MPFGGALVDAAPGSCATKPSQRTARTGGGRRCSMHASFWLASRLGVSTYGIYQMLQVVRFASMTLLQGVDDFPSSAFRWAWIAFAAGSVIARRLESVAIPVPRGLPAGLTALVMPIYNEDPVRTNGRRLQAMAGGAAGNRGQPIFRDRGALGFDPTPILGYAENRGDRQAAHISLSSVMPVWYRRRWSNVARKAGNLEDFVTRLGRSIRAHDRGSTPTA